VTKVREVMTAPVVTVSVDDPVARIAATLNRHRISAVPVIDTDGAVVGLVSEYDLLARPAVGTAREVMTTAVITVTESTDVDDVRRVLSAGKLVGIVSRADIVALLITEWVCRVCGESARREQPPLSCLKCHSTNAFVIQEQLPGS
jgi:CBS-domain-containing membrane protein